MKTRKLMAVVFAMAMMVASFVQAADKVFTGANKTNGDNWNVDSNWTPNGIPSGTDNVIIPAAKQVTCNSTTTPTYSGNFTLGAGAYLGAGYGIGSINSYKCFGTPGTTMMTVSNGVQIAFRDNFSPTMPAITLAGNLTITLGSSTAASTDPIFSYPITGSYTITFKGKSDGSATFNASSSNTFAAFFSDGQYGSGFPLNANVAGALGTGDVTIYADSSGNVSGKLLLGATNAIASTATLTIYGPASTTKLKVTVDNTIKRLVVDGVEQMPGTYGKTGSGAQYQVSWFDSTSTALLTVTGAPSQYWDIDSTTSGAGGATPAGTWDPSTTSNWNSDSTGGAGGSVGTWTAGEQATFAAGTDATGSYAVTVSGTPDIGGLSFEEGTVTLSSGGLRMTSDSLVTVASGVSAEISTPISNDSARQLSKVGSGTLTLSGNSSYTGVTRVSGGVLAVPSLASASSDSPIGNYPTAGAGGLLLANGTFRYTGGTVSINRGFTLGGSSTLDINTAGTALTFGNCESKSQPVTLTITGGTGSSLAIGQARIVEAAQLTLNPTSASMTVGSVNGYTSYPANSSITLGGTTTNNVVTGNIDVTNPPGSGYTQNISLNKNGISEWTIPGIFSTSGSLTVNNGTLKLSGNNSYTGATTINGGIVMVGVNAPSNANGAFGKATSDVNLGVANGNTDAGIIITGAFTVARIIRNATQNDSDTGTRVLTLGGNAAHNSTFSGNIFLGTADRTSKGLTLTAAVGGQVTFSGIIQEAGGTRTAAEMSAATNLVAITKVDDGTVVLSNVNTYLGKTVVSEGTLKLGNNNVLPATAMTIGSATLDAGAYTDTLGTLDVTGAAVINLGSGGALAFADSSAVDWTGGTLTITGTFVKSSSIRFGTSSTGLTKDQLALISVTGYPSLQLDPDGYLTPSLGTLIQFK